MSNLSIINCKWYKKILIIIINYNKINKQCINFENLTLQKD